MADPDGRVLVVTPGTSRLATAGTGDVLSGVIGAFLARGLPALEAAALAPTATAGPPPSARPRAWSPPTCPTWSRSGCRTAVDRRDRLWRGSATW